MRIISDAPRRVDVCSVDGMFLVHLHVYLPSTFGSVVIVTLARLVRHANRVNANRVDFTRDTYKYPSINDINREVHGLVQGEVNVFGPEQRMPKYSTQALKSKSLHVSCDYSQMGGAEMSMLTPCELYFGLIKSSTDSAYLMDKCHVKMSWT